ncbi:outer membrane beta-barrel protein [Pedobacter sp. KR3-3]|uniref:Outer membrane beta-barrel protein n=1 Tax=Pedobacter albus TaxID=3113905 RepID=A0ABU7I3S5_9SPHI|nr:outer membrane beta-barrel protein [Pedobacter sp. KR3-3]MEE1944078.1 outer membrane beta-barrel protein [Pedobacter sp. KR3-3]
MSKKLLLLVLLAISACQAFAQKASIKGSVVDTIEKKKLQNSSVLLIRSKDSILVKSVRANAQGEFELTNLQKGDYSLLISYPKMADFIRDIRLTDSSKFNLGPIHMETKTFLLNEVVVRAQKEAIRMKGDTIVYQADSFAVKPNANVQDLLRRLPGIEVDKNGAIKAAGEDVNTVLVEGEEFFGDDPLLATKYLKASAVSEVQVYDKKSKEAELTGIDDGKKDKIINIKLKENAKNGYLSTLDANSDLDHYKNLGGMLGVYKGKLKAAIYGNTTNLNQDSKVTSAMSKLKGNDYDVIEVGDDGSTMMISYGGDDDDYFSPTNGLPNYSAYGAHFSDKWNQNKLGLKLNYKNTDTKVIDNRTSNGQRLLPNGTSFFSSGTSTENSNKGGQSVKGNVDITLDSLSTMKISFSGKTNFNKNNSTNYNQSLNDQGLFVSKNNQQNSTDTDSELFNGNINYTHKSKKKGRTLSIDLQPETQNSKGIENSLNVTNYYNDQGQMNRTENLDLFKDNASKQTSLGTRISYTEPLGKKWQLQTAYSFKTVISSSNRMVYDNLQNRKAIDSLSNNFDFNNFSNIGKVVLQYRAQKFSVSGGVEATQTSFELDDIDRNNKFNRNYLNWAPRGNFNYRISKSTSLSLNYNGNTSQPSLDQLQPIRQINNPLYQVVGNSNLKPSFSNSIGLNFNSYQFKSEQFIYGYLSYNFTRNAIASTQTVDEFNKTISSYTNLNGNNSIYANASYQKGFSKLHFRASFSISYNSSNYVSILNNKLNKNFNGQLNLRPGFSYYTDKVQVNYNPSVTFLNSNSSLGSINNGKSYTHNHEISGTIQLPYKTEFNTSISLSYRPANQSFNTPLNVALWNCYISKKMLPTDALEMKLSVSDILNQKIGYNRYVGGNYINETTFSYIPRYILIGLTYNLSGNFAKAAK